MCLFILLTIWASNAGRAMEEWEYEAFMSSQRNFTIDIVVKLSDTVYKKTGFLNFAILLLK